MQRNTPCTILTLDLPKFPKGEIAYINGMNQRPHRARWCSEILSMMAGGYNVYTIYNPTHGFIRDFATCFVTLYSLCLSPPAKKLHEKWNAFFAQASPDEKFLQFCHSQGAIQVRNALLYYPHELRNRIIVVAIAPAAYIPQEICYRAFHYVSRRDIIPKLDRVGRKRCQKSVFILEPQCQAPLLDHEFLSPTYQVAIEYHIKEYITMMQIPSHD